MKEVLVVIFQVGISIYLISNIVPLLQVTPWMFCCRWNSSKYSYPLELSDWGQHIQRPPMQMPALHTTNAKLQNLEAATAHMAKHSLPSCAVPWMDEHRWAGRKSFQRTRSFRWLFRLRQNTTLLTFPRKQANILLCLDFYYLQGEYLSRHHVSKVGACPQAPPQKVLYWLSKLQGPQSKGQDEIVIVVYVGTGAKSLCHLSTMKHAPYARTVQSTLSIWTDVFSTLSLNPREVQKTPQKPPRSLHSTRLIQLTEPRKGV